MKTGARLPRGIRWLGLMALGSVSLAVQAEEKIVLRPPGAPVNGGYYRAQATGLYKNMVSTSRIAPADRRSAACSCCCRSGPIIGYDLQLLEGIQRGFQAKAIAAPFQYDPQGLLAHADVTSLQGLKTKPCWSPARSGDVVAVAEGAIPAERRAGSPLYLQYSTLCRR